MSQQLFAVTHHQSGALLVTAYCEDKLCCLICVVSIECGSRLVKQ